MKRITKEMVTRGGWRYCCVCRQLGPRVKAHWQHEGREYCDEHKPKPTPTTQPYPNPCAVTA
jgi:predicted GIY-YIG superfamily endonuclease